MAINKNFVVKNGLEVNTQLIYADAESNKVGIASTQPNVELDVRGGIAATNTTVSGVSTVQTAFKVGSGIGGTVFIALDENLVGVGTSQPAYLFDIRSPGTGTTALYVQGDVRITGDLNLDDINLDYAEIQHMIVGAASTFSGDLDINASIDVDGKSELDELNVTGLSTFTSNVDINADVDIDRSALIGGSLTVTGLSTFSNNIDINADVDINNSISVNAGLTVTGLSTFSNNIDINADVDIDRSALIGGGLNVTGLSTFAGIGTFGSHLYVDGDFYSRGSLNFSAFGATRGTVSGILTTSNLRVTGLSTLTGRADLNGGLSVTGISTFANNLDVNADIDVSRSVAISNGFSVVGISTHTGLTDLNGGLSVTGISTFANNLDVNADVDVSRSVIIGGGISATGIGTIGNLLITPIGTGATVGNGAGIVTFYGDGSGLTNTPAGTPAGTDGQIQFNVSDTFTASSNLIFDGSNLYVSGIVTASTLNIAGTDHDINGAIALDNVTVSAGTTIGGTLDVNGTDHDINGAIELDHVTISGIATISSNLDVNGTNHDINGAIALDHVTVSGISTISSAIVGGATTFTEDLVIEGNTRVVGVLTASSDIRIGTKSVATNGKAVAVAMVFG